LGTGSHAEAVRQEIIRTAWLHAHGANVPPILRTLIRPDFAALLMAALPSEPIQGCDLPPKRVVEILARALSDLHSLPVASCPFDETIQTRLERAQKAVAEQRVDPAQFRTENLKMTPEELFRRLLARVPSTEDLVVVHGDATFTNVLVDGLQRIGFVDCGHSGRGDRYIDLALAVSEIEERYGKDWTPAFCRAYGLSNWDRDKAEFFLDLYEFF
jgi:aminoglycoside 3'-phosphotransferase-2